MALQSKAIEIRQDLEGNIAHITLSGKLSGEDYEMLVPEIESLIQKYQKIRILLELRDFHGWGAGALWEDTKFALRHFSDIERIAMVGDKRWEKGMAYFCKPFTAGSLRYFDIGEIDQARIWVSEA